MAVTRNVTYGLVKQVENFLHLGSTSSSTTPSTQEIIQYIHQAEDEIDRRTLHAWRDKRWTMEYNFPLEEFSAKRTFGDSLWFDGVMIPLSHRSIKTLDADKGDKLTVRQGGSRIDYLANKTEGINKDFFLTPERGILHIYRRWMIQANDKVRITYRYGSGAKTEMTGSVLTTDSTFEVDSTDGFEVNGILFGVHDNSGTTEYEIMYYDGITDNDFLNVARGQHGTSALAYTTDETVWSVPADINEACIKLVAINIAHNDSLSKNEGLGEGRDYEDISQRISNWTEEVDKILQRRVEMVRV